MKPYKISEVRFIVGDKAGNTTSTLIKVKVDNTPPEILNIIPQDKSVVNSTYSMSADYNDAGSSIDVNSFSMLIDGINETRNALITNTSMHYKPSLQDEKHFLKLSINDSVGNSKTVITSFELDTTAPEVEINVPADNSFVRQTIAVSGIASDLHLDMVSLEIDGIKVSSESNYKWDTTLGNDRNYEIKLSAVDVVKNLASTSINVIVDNTPPVIQLYPANGTEFYSDQALAIDYNVTDATSGIASSSVTLDSIAVTKGDIIDLRTLSIGSHIIQVNANDNAGNSAESSTTFIVKPLQAIVEISPNTLNINSSGNWITGFIEVPGYYPESIDISTVILNDAIRAEARPFGIDDHDENGMPDLMVKFNRSEVRKIVMIGDIITLYITGKVDGATFSGNTSIRVIGSATSDKSKENTKGNGKQ